MKLLWRLLIAFWVKQPITKRIPWSDDDRTTLYLFLESGCGKRFILKLREQAADICFRSVYSSPDGAVSAAGYARGACDSLGTIFRLAKSFPNLESEYAVADGERPPGQMPVKEQAGKEAVIGGGGMIAPHLEF